MSIGDQLRDLLGRLGLVRVGHTSLGSVTPDDTARTPVPRAQPAIPYELGDRVRDALNPVVEEELWRLLRLKMSGEEPEVALQPAALAKEVCRRLVDLQPIGEKKGYRDRLPAIAAYTVRRILMEIARTRMSLERAGGVPEGTSDTARVSATWSANLLALDDALTALAAREQRQSQVVELKVFGGLSIEEVSDELSVAPATLKHDWKTASGALSHELRRMDQRADGPPT